MLELNDFSSIFQMVIAFYSVYAIANKSILNSFIFSVIEDLQNKLNEKKYEQLKKVISQYEAYNETMSQILNENQVMSYIFKKKQFDPEILNLLNCMWTDMESFRNAILHNDKINFHYKVYERNQYFFSVLSVDMIALCLFLMVMGVLDYKIIWVTDYICFTIITLVAILQIHCYLYEYLVRIRSIKRFKPTFKGHLMLMLIFVIGAFYFFDYENLTLGHYSDIKVYMTIFAILVVTPPIIIFGQYYRLYKKSNNVVKDSVKDIEMAMNYYHENIKRYKESQTQVDSPSE